MSDEFMTGGRQLHAFLQQVPAKVERNIMRAALRAGANEFKAEARENVAVDEGDLRASIRVTTRSKRGTVYASVKAGGKRAPHWHWVEFGTMPHKIKAKPERALSVGGAVLRSVDHPGSRPKPYMRPALDTKTREAIAAVGAKIRQRLTIEGLNVPAPEDT